MNEYVRIPRSRRVRPLTLSYGQTPSLSVFFVIAGMKEGPLSLYHQCHLPKNLGLWLRLSEILGETQTGIEGYPVFFTYQRTRCCRSPRVNGLRGELYTFAVARCPRWCRLERLVLEEEHTESIQNTTPPLRCELEAGFQPNTGGQNPVITVKA